MKPDVAFSSIKDKERSDCLVSVLNGANGYLSQFKKDAFVGIKMTIGDEGSTANIKPDLVRIIVDKLKEQGAKPFVFDTNVIYQGQRQNSVDHLNLAYRKGFTPDNLGCPYIIADSVFGTDSQSIAVDFKNVQEIKVPSVVNVLEDLIVLTHITGHIMSGFAASIKNVAMGMASRAGKQIQHSSLKPTINIDNCTLCGSCIEVCPASAISEVSGKAFVNSNLCIGCCECIALCKLDAVNINWREDADIFAERMAEYALGILTRIRRKVFINFAFDITKECVFSSNTVELSNDELVSPWRVILLGKSAGDLVTNTMTMSLATPCKLENTDWIEPIIFYNMPNGVNLAVLFSSCPNSFSYHLAPF